MNKSRGNQRYRRAMIYFCVCGFGGVRHITTTPFSPQNQHQPQQRSESIYIIMDDAGASYPPARLHVTQYIHIQAHIQIHRRCRAAHPAAACACAMRARAAMPCTKCSSVRQHVGMFNQPSNVSCTFRLGAVRRSPVAQRRQRRAREERWPILYSTMRGGKAPPDTTPYADNVETIRLFQRACRNDCASTFHHPAHFAGRACVRGQAGKAAGRSGVAGAARR